MNSFVCIQKVPQLKNFLHRVPSASEADVEGIYNGPESFTPDAKMIMGESAEVDCYYVAAGTVKFSVFKILTN